MGAVTYPDATVAAMLNEHYIPVQVNIAKASALAEKYQAIWTPNINIVNQKEKVLYHLEGWLSPSEFAPMLLVALGHHDLHRKNFDQAGSKFKNCFDIYPQSFFAAEAVYYLGVSRYLASHQDDHLIAEWNKLQQHYPTSQWALRSMVA